MSEDTPPRDGSDDADTDTARHASSDRTDGGTIDGSPTNSGESADGELDEAEFWAKYGMRPADETDDEEFWSGYGRRNRTEQLLQGGDTATTGLENISHDKLRQYYGPLRTLFKTRANSYQSFQRQLVQARIPTTYDQYLAAIVSRMVVLLAAGVLFGVVAAGGILAGAEYGYLESLLARTGFGSRTLAAVVGAVAVFSGALGAGLYWLWHRVLKIQNRITQRRREINYNLPYAMTFMYALSRADVNFDQIVTRLAASTDTYGAVAEEFDRVVKDDVLFGNSLHTGLENLRAVTPSEELRRIIEDLQVILETGGDTQDFLRDEIDTQLQTAVAEQESYIGKLELLAEVFIVGLVAAPLFVLVLLMVMAFAGTETLTTMTLFVYVALPLALGGFLVAVDIVGTPFVERPMSFDGSRENGVSAPDSDSLEWGQAYERAKQLSGIRTLVRDQVIKVGEHPAHALLFSVPLAVALPVIGIQTGTIIVSRQSLLATPVLLTSELVVGPLVVATVPVAAVYEYRRRQQLATKRRFPGLLTLLATSNRRGLSLTRSLDIVSRSTTGRLAEQLRLLRNDISWNSDLPAAFRAFGDRLRSPTLARTARLLAEGSRATSDLHVILNVAATDISERTRLERERWETLSTYLAIVVIGFLVYLLVVVILASNFLDPIEALNATADATVDGGPASIASVPVPELRVILFHSTLIQGFGTGVVAGKLSENSLAGGLKYGLGLTVLTVVVFALL